MKKIFTLLAFAACCAAAAWSCSDEYDDSGLRQEIADIRQEIASMKEQVNSLKTLVDALNGNKFITNYTESDDGWSITFNDGKTITIRDGEKGADAPVLGIAKFEGVYYWTLGGADEWLLDDAGGKIPVAGQDGKTPSVDEEGYWTIDGEPVKGADGQPVKAVGEDGDSFFEDVRQTDDEVIFILAGGETIRLPKAREVNFVIERTTLTLKYGQTEKTGRHAEGRRELFDFEARRVARFARRRRAVDHGSRRREYLCRKERQGDGRRRGRYGDGCRCGRSQSSGVRRQQRRFERLGGVELTDK